MWVPRRSIWPVSAVPSVFHSTNIYCVPVCARLSVGCWGYGGTWSLFSRCLRLLSSVFSVLQRQRLYANGCNGISPPSFAPGYQSSCPFFPFSIQTAPFRSSKPKSDGSRCGDFYIFVNNHLTLQNVREKMNLLEDCGVESLEEQSQGHSGAS